jgi:hypothetical protein
MCTRKPYEKQMNFTTMGTVIFLIKNAVPRPACLLSRSGLPILNPQNPLCAGGIPATKQTPWTLPHR